MLDIVRIVFARLPGLPPSAPRPDSDALHPLRNGPPAIPAGESLIERSPAEPDTGQAQQQQPQLQQQSNGEPDAAPSGVGETKQLLESNAEAQPTQNDVPPAAAQATPLQLPRPDSTGWNSAGALAPCVLAAANRRHAKRRWHSHQRSISTDSLTDARRVACHHGQLCRPR